MASIFITGSSDGLGLLTAKSLLQQGHSVVLHARNEAKAAALRKQVPAATAVLTGDLSDMEQVQQLAADVNAQGLMDVVIHNAGVYQAAASQIQAVNVLAPYVLTSLIQPPGRLVYLCSSMHLGGHFRLNDHMSYSDSKLYLLLLCKAVARKWPHVYANAVDPGWVPTKMGGAGAPDDLQRGYETQVWLANSADAVLSGRYYFHMKEQRYHADADHVMYQDTLLDWCAQRTGVRFHYI